jgi:farnesyl-diphosphate farnesyltransferase
MTSTVCSLTVRLEFMAQADSDSQRANAFCREILPAVSRTFALSIRLLPGELGAAVRCSYLICRIADTIEDETSLTAEDKATLFDMLALAFDDVDAAEQLTRRASPLRCEPADSRLIHHTDIVFAAFRGLSPRTREHVRRWVREMIAGMRKFVLAYPRGVRIQSLDEYKEYCYYVAGTVGYLLTDLWHEHSRSIGAREHAFLRQRCRNFAEALQTVNILRDVVRDAERENAIYIPEELLRAHGSAQSTILAPDRAKENHAAFGALIQLAWRDLDQATAYLLAIPRRAVAIRLSCALPLLFAYATLRDLARRPSAIARREVVKISRSEVKSLTVLSLLGVLSNRALAALVERTRTRIFRPEASSVS